MARDVDIFDESVRHQVYLERYASHAAGRVKTKAAKLEASVFEAMDGYAEVASLETEELAALIAEAQASETQVMVDALAELTATLADLADYEAKYSAGTLKAFAKGTKIKALRAGEAYEAALAQPIPATGHLLESFIQGWSDNEMEAVNNVVSKGYTQGWTNAQIKQAIRGTKALNYADGEMARLGRNTDAVVKTSVQHVANTGRMETWARNSDVVEGYIIVATLDGKTTQICRSLDGKAFPLGKGPRPPFHIRCRTSTAPKMMAEFAFLEKGATRSAEFGPVSAKLNYYDWLKTQSETFQDDAIGVSRGKLFRDGGLSADKFAKLNLGRNFEPLTLDEMRKKEPAAFERAGL